MVIPTAGSWFIAFLGDNGYIEIAPRINIEVAAAVDPCGAGSSVDGTTCGAGRAGDVCHGGQCEFITWDRADNLQCQTFQADNTALRTLEAAQAACEASATCGGVTDYWCNGMFGEEGADWYALCEGWMTIPHDNPAVCMWASPAPPPSGVDLCAAVTCAASSSCVTAGTCDPLTGNCGAEVPVTDGTACDTGDGDSSDDSCHAGVCESIAWARTEGRQCASFLPADPALNTLALAEAACSANPQCGGVTDMYCNGMFSASDYFGLCDGWETVDASDPATTGYPLCVFPRVGATQEIAWTTGSPYEPLLVTVGDILHFTWGGTHDVVIATDGTCDSVSSSTAVLDNSGDFSVMVTQPGTTTYACSVGSHCSGGSQIITVNAVWPDVTPGTCSINDYEIQNYVVWSSAGHDIDHMQGTAAECMTACCSAVRPGHANHPPAPCVGFGRRKAAALDASSDCWLKTYALPTDRVVNNPTYEFFENAQVRGGDSSKEKRSEKRSDNRDCSSLGSLGPCEGEREQSTSADGRICSSSTPVARGFMPCTSPPSADCLPFVCAAALRHRAGHAPVRGHRHDVQRDLRTDAQLPER